MTVRQFSGYRKFKSIYVETMLLFKVIGGMAIILNSMVAKDMQLLGYETNTTYGDLKIGWPRDIR